MSMAILRYSTLIVLSFSVAGTLGDFEPNDRCGSANAGQGDEPECAASPSNTKLPLYLISEKLKEQTGARCLDGTAPGFYFQAAPSNSATPTSWVLYFKGGGWCYDEASCAARALGELGSNLHFPKSFSFSGPMDSEASVNPEFAGFNRVILWYCDGASFTGDVDKPYFHAPTNQTLYFRGRRNLDAILQTLRTEHGLANATEVLVSGGSAGGLAAYHHTDYIHEQIKTFQAFSGNKLTKFKAAPVSGFFLLHDNAVGVAAYPNEMQYVFNMQNSTGGVHPACIAALPAHQQWKCIFANYSYAHSTTPMFPLQSALDSWQMASIFQFDKACRSNNFANCNATEITELNGYATNLLDDIQRTEKSRRPGEGGFVESCLEHVAAQGASFNRYKINNTSMQRALSKWWHAPSTESADEHWFLPCKLNTAAPHQCNPSCSTSTAILV